MCLKSFATRYVRKNDLSGGYLRQLISAANALSREVNEAATVNHLTIDNINAVIANPDIGKTTRNNRRRMLLTLAHEAARNGLIERIDPFFVDRIKKDKKLPQGYSFEQARLILKTIVNPPDARLRWMSFMYESVAVTRQQWWLAYLSSCWDTGHPQDMRELLKTELEADGRIWRMRHKTSKVIQSQLSPYSLKAIKEIDRKGKYVFPRWCGCKNTKCLSEEFRVIAEMAGCPGFIKWFRSGAGTEVERVHPQRGHEFLSNTRRVFEENYMVSRHLKCREVLHPKPLLSLDD